MRHPRRLVACLVPARGGGGCRTAGRSVGRRRTLLGTARAAGRRAADARPSRPPDWPARGRSPGTEWRQRRCRCTARCSSRERGDTSSVSDGAHPDDRRRPESAVAPGPSPGGRRVVPLSRRLRADRDWMLTAGLVADGRRDGRRCPSTSAWAIRYVARDRAGDRRDELRPVQRLRAAAPRLVPVSLLPFAGSGLYRQRRGTEWFDDIPSVFRSTALRRRCRSSPASRCCATRRPPA